MGPISLRALSAETTLVVQAGSAKQGFENRRGLSILVDITEITFTGGVAPAVQLLVWIQRTPDDGVTWDDLVALASSVFTADTPEKLIGDVSERSGTPAIPAVTQDGGGAPPFAQRGVAKISDKLRAKWILSKGAGDQTTQSVTFSITADN